MENEGFVLDLEAAFSFFVNACVLGVGLEFPAEFLGFVFALGEDADLLEEVVFVGELKGALFAADSRAEGDEGVVFV